MFPVRTIVPLKLRGGGATESTVAGGYNGPRTNKKGPAPGRPASTPASPGAASSTAGFGEPSSPATSKLNRTPEPVVPRPTITIYTAVDDEEEDGTRSTATPATMGGPTTPGPSPSSPAALAATAHARSSAAAMKPTVTSLSPEHHMALYGNGLAGPEGKVSLARTLALSREVSCHADPGDSLSLSTIASASLPQANGASAAALASPLSRHLGSRQHSTAVLDDEEGRSLGNSVRYSATPVVPLHAGADAQVRRDAAAKFQYRIDKAAAETAALSAQAEAERKEKEAAAKARQEADALLSKREREKREKKEKKENGKHKPSEPLAAPPAQKLTGRALKEYLVRVGIERINQRASQLHLQVHRVRNDGNCQFRSISHQLFGSEAYHDIVRSHVVSYMRSVRAEQYDFYFESTTEADQYFDRIASAGAWGDELTLRGASDSLYVNMHILSSEAKNCFITYRPSETAPPPPAFLVDVTTLRERRQRERSLASRPPSRVPSTLHFLGGGGDSHTNGTRENGAGAAPSADAGEKRGADDDDDDAAIDAAAIQHALEKRLHHASIVSATPFVSHTNSLAASFAPSASFVMPPPPIPSAAPTDRFAAQATDEDAKGNRGDGPSALDKFTRAGATLKDRETGATDVSLLLSRPDKATLLPPRASPGPLLRPLASAGTNSQNTGGLVSPLHKQTSLSSSFSVWPQNHGASLPEAHPAFPTKEGGHVLLVAAPRPRHTGAGEEDAATSDMNTPARQTSHCRGSATAWEAATTAEEPSPAASLGSPCPMRSVDTAPLAGHPASLPVEMEVGVCFAFEKRTEPIDIFLSYLYPVHYNSIELMENSFASPTTADAPGELPSAAKAQGTRSPATESSQSLQTVSETASGTAAAPQHLVTVPFLKPQSS